MITRAGIEDEFFNIIKAITGLADDYIRITNPTNGMPAYEVTDNVAFITVGSFDSEYCGPVEITYENDEEADVLIEKRKRTIGRAVRLNFYGPNADDNAQKTSIVVQDNFIMKVLRAAGVFLISSSPVPPRVPILLNQQWYEQVTLDLKFYQNLVYNNNRNYIESVEITIATDTGETRDINVNLPETT